MKTDIEIYNEINKKSESEFFEYCVGVSLMKIFIFTFIVVLISQLITWFKG